jgi:hypothetical protein
MKNPVPRSLLAAAALLATQAAGCEPYRIEYRHRPSYYQQMNEETLPERVVLDDGTVIVYESRVPSSRNLDPKGDLKKFEIREEHEDGSVTLRALLPEHVIANTLHCLRYEEYQLLWDELVAEESKRTWAAEGKGVEDFTAFMRDNRLELAQMLSRMRIGLATNQTVVDRKPGGVLECGFWPQTAMLFEYKKVVLVREDIGLKLLAIR